MIYEMHFKETISEPSEFQKEKRNRGDRYIIGGKNNDRELCKPGEDLEI